MPKFKVVSDLVGLPGPEREVRRGRNIFTMVTSKYHRRGEIVELNDADAKRLVERGHLEPAKKGAAAKDADTGLTHKQSLVKEASELGLDTEGTIPELEARLADHQAQSEE